MAGTENLIPFSQRSKEEAREKGRKGGINSGKTRRKNAQIKKCLNTLLAMSPSDNIKKMLKKNGFDLEDDTNNTEVLAYMMYIYALKGNSKMFEMIFKYAGQDPEEIRKDMELKLKEKALKGVEEQNGKLADLINGLKDVENNDIHEETAAADEPVATE